MKRCFLPTSPECWTDSKKRKVTFLPFLVILARHGRQDAVWLPYWHVVEDSKRVFQKYGQWAPFMDAHRFEDLISQARSAGLEI